MGMERPSLKRIAGLLFLAAGASMAVLLAAVIYRRATHGWGYSVTEDLVVLSIMGALAVLLSTAGFFLIARPPEPPV